MFPAINLGALERYRVPVEWKGELSDVDPGDRETIPFPRPKTEAATTADIAEIDRLQEVLYAQAKYALLVMLQGPDTSGKDGTIRRVFSHDTGQGIPADNLNSIFEPFIRLDATRSEGLGLGPFIVKRAAHWLGHRIELYSAVGRGSCFSVATKTAISASGQTSDPNIAP